MNYLNHLLVSKAINFKIGLFSTIFILSGIKSAYAHYSYYNSRKECLSATNTDFQLPRKLTSKNYFNLEKLLHKNLLQLSNAAILSQFLSFSFEDLHTCLNIDIAAINDGRTTESLSKDYLSKANSTEKSIDSFHQTGVYYASQITGENQVMKKCI